MKAGKKSNTKAERTAAIEAHKKSGAAWAREYIESVKHDPKSTDLKGIICDAEGLLFNGNDAELDAFYDTLRDAIAKSPLPTDRLLTFVKEIGQCAYAIKNLSTDGIGESDEEDAICMGIKALAEKSGYLSDKCLALLGEHTGACGEFEEWAALGAKESTDEAQEAI